MLTAGLGVSEMTIGWDMVVLELGGGIPLLPSNDAADRPLENHINVGNEFSPRGKCDLVVIN